MFRYSTMLFTFNGVGDRFIKQYFEPVPASEAISRLKGRGFQGVELQNPNHVTLENLSEMQDVLARNGLVPVIVNTPMAGSLEWIHGSFTSKHAEIRAKAVARVQQAMEVSRRLGTNMISIFMGQDGFDYPLATDYRDAWENELACFDACAAYAPEVKIAIEYKPFEPRTHQFLSGAAKAILLCEEIGRPNIGLLVDAGHAWMAGENVGESIALASRYHRLFHVHMNDNFGTADDDLGAGAVRFPEYLEAMYWLRECGYQGWISLDVHSPRENSEEILHASLDYLKAVEQLVDSLGMEKLKETVSSRDGVAMLRLLQEIIAGNN